MDAWIFEILKTMKLLILNFKTFKGMEGGQPKTL